MKTISIERYPDSDWTAMAEMLASDNVVSPTGFPVSLIADSALVRVSTTLFVPDFARDWLLHIVPFVTIGRLGKSIPERFAHRYTEGFGLGVRLVPPIPDTYVNAALVTSFDGAFAPSEPVEIPSGNDMLRIECRQCGAAGNEVSVELPVADMHIDGAVSLVSHYVTLKTGDIISPCMLPVTFPAVIDSRIEIDLDGKRILTLKIK